ncbi:MAG: hypothetical protein Q8L22_27305 [Reyranella sp.]|nr:hypothetical protein [Reyranella sp.]
MRSTLLRVVPVILLLTSMAGAIPSGAQLPQPPTGGPGNVPVNPPTTGFNSFVGDWKLSWDDPGDPNCPCRGALWIDINETADGTSLAGRWSTKDGKATLRGTMSYNADYWSGRFAFPDDGTGFPVKGNFRLELRDANTLTGSYQREGTGIPFRWTATRD